MKRTTLTLLMLLVLTSLLSALEISYRIENYPDVMEMLEEEITAMAEEGYTPLGITHGDGKAYLLYVSGILDFEGWQLVRFESLWAMQNGMTDLIEAGMFPVGFSWTSRGYHVLAVMSRNDVSAWQLVPSGFGEAEASKALLPYVKNGFVPAGIGGKDGRLLTLVLQTSEFSGERWNLVGYPADGNFITRKMGEMLKGGYLPWGIHYQDGKIYVSYIRL
jgi:hypothetical protein